MRLIGIFRFCQKLLCAFLVGFIVSLSLLALTTDVCEVIYSRWKPLTKLLLFVSFLIYIFYYVICRKSDMVERGVSHWTTEEERQWRKYVLMRITRNMMNQQKALKFRVSKCYNDGGIDNLFLATYHTVQKQCAGFLSCSHPHLTGRAGRTDNLLCMLQIWFSC